MTESINTAALHSPLARCCLEYIKAEIAVATTADQYHRGEVTAAELDAANRRQRAARAQVHLAVQK